MGTKFKSTMHRPITLAVQLFNYMYTLRIETSNTINKSHTPTVKLRSKYRSTDIFEKGQISFYNVYLDKSRRDPL